MAVMAMAAVLAVTGCGGSGSPPAPGSSAGTATTARSGVIHGALFGGDMPLARVDGQLGRRLAIVRSYYLIGQQFPTQADERLMAGGSTLLVSLDSRPGPTAPSYASIASGHYDGAIRTFLHEVDQAAVRHHIGAIYICFEHEANAPRHTIYLGSPAQYIQAWDHVHQLAVSAHLNWNDGGRLHWVWIMTSQGYRIGPSAPEAVGRYWPGASEVDVVAVDGYNSGSCRQSFAQGTFVAAGTQTITPATLFGPVVAFARGVGNLPVFVAEWGTVPYQSPTVVSTFINQMHAYVTANHEIAAALYWNAHAKGNSCNYSLNGDRAALSALSAMGRAQGLQGHVIAAR